MKKPFYILILIIALFCVSFVATDCKHSPTGPSDTTKDPRTYTWTIDTLSYPGSMQTSMRDIWASSPTDVYVVGHNDQNRGLMYHYNGTTWSDVKLAASQGGQILGAIDLSAVCGFASNDIYAVGERMYTNSNPPPNFLDSSLIIHYDGQSWKEIAIPRKAGVLYSIWGSTATNVWISGANGILIHYDGLSWSFVQFDPTLSIGSITGYNSSNIYAIAGWYDRYSPYDSTMYYLCFYNGSRWSKTDSFLICPTSLTWKFGTSEWISSTLTLYSAGYGVYKRTGSEWTTLLTNDWPLKVFGNNDNNIFAVGDKGRVFHWNGSDWKRLTELEDVDKTLYATWINNTETFIVGNNGYKTFIFHGK
jgi:hypothetical protein